MTAKRLAFYTRDTGDPDNTADDQWQRLQAATQGEDAQVVRDYVDHKSMSLHRMLGEATQETPSFDEVLVTDAALLGDMEEEEVQERLAQIGEKGSAGQGLGRRRTPLHVNS